MVPGAVSINNSDATFTTPFQLDITTTHTIAPPTPVAFAPPALALETFGATRRAAAG